jgi:hypothetical protein
VCAAWLTATALSHSATDHLDPYEFVRPVAEKRRLVLVVRPGHKTGPVLLEQPDPTPCCADHA